MIVLNVRSAAMLYLVITVCWNLVDAATEYGTVVSSSVDPWSPIVGDTEGVPAITDQATTIPKVNNGRRAVFGPIDNIRKQLMHDNYDYTNNHYVETKSPEVRQTTTTAGEGPNQATFIRTTSTNPSTSTVRYYRAFQMEPNMMTTHKQFQIQMQVASVRMPTKIDSSKIFQMINDSPRVRPLEDISPPDPVATKQNKVTSGKIPVKSDYSKMFRSFDDSPNMRAHDNEAPPIPATKMHNNVESQIVVSKKDLLFYIDDNRLTRKNAKGIMLRRQKYDDNPENYMANKMGPKPFQSNNEYINDNKMERLSKYYNFDSDARRSNQLLNKTYTGTKNHTHSNDVVPTNQPVQVNEMQVGNQYDNTNDIVQSSVNNKQIIKQKNVESRNIKSVSESSLYSDFEVEEEQNLEYINKENDQCSQCSKENQILKCNHNNSNQYNTTHTLQHMDKNQITINNNNIRVPCLPNEENLVSSAINNSYRRMNHMRRPKKQKHKRINLGDIQNVNLLQSKRKRKKDTNVHTGPQYNLKKHQRNRQQRQKNKILKFKRNKKAYRLKTTLPSKRNNHKKNVLGNIPNKNMVDRHNLKNKNTRKNRKVLLNRRVHKKDDKHIEDDALDSQQVDKIDNKKVVKQANMSDTQEDHHSHSVHVSYEEVNETRDYPDTNGDKLNDDTGEDEISDKVHNDIPNDKLKDNHNNSQEILNDTMQYVDSMDNEDLTELYGRRMLNYKAPRQFDKDNNHWNNRHQHYKPNNSQDDTQNLKRETSSSAKYKIIKIPTVGGARRSIKGHRQIVQERGANGVVLYAPDDAPFPQFRLPRDRRQYMDERIDKRSPLDHLSKISKTRRSSHRHNRKNGS